MSSAMIRNGGGQGGADALGDDTNAGVEAVRILEAPEPSDDAFEEAGVETAAALALVYDDDERNIRAALTARRINPRLRLVIRLYNRKLGQHLETLLDQAAAVAAPGLDRAALDASTTVLSDADTAAPALAATVLTGSSKVIQAEGLLLRAAERTLPADDPATAHVRRAREAAQENLAEARRFVRALSPPIWRTAPWPPRWNGSRPARPAPASRCSAR